MQIIPLKLSHNTFFCPVTGEQLLFSDDYHTSPATLFHFMDIDGGDLVNPKPEIELLFNTTLEEINNGLYTDYDFKSSYTMETKAFEILVYEKLKQEDNYVLFEIGTTGFACGPNSSKIYIGIDMNYQSADDLEKENTFDFEGWFPNFNDYEAVLLNATQTKPSLDGYALYMEGTISCGGFYFFNTEDEWNTLLPALVFLDHINQNQDSITTEQLNGIIKVYSNYFNSGIYDKLPEHFTPDLNELLQENKIIFFGKTIELLEPNSNFTKVLIEQFGNNPKDNSNGYLEFLKGYCRV
jgi:hypothetical protein